jgi:hypothetical protein
VGASPCGFESRLRHEETWKDGKDGKDGQA